MITVICNLGINHKIIGGQFVRSQNISDYLKDNLNEKVEIIDVGSRNKILIVLKGLKGLIFSRRVVLIPGPNLLRLFSYLKINSILKKIVLIAVGGWIGDLASNNKNTFYFTQKIHSIWVQTNGLKQELILHDIKSYILLNFKNNLVPRKPQKTLTRPLKIVFMSRVSREKGIFEAIDAAKELPNIMSLDIFGPMHDCEINIDGFKNIKYLGVLDSADIQNTLKNYDCLIFPTRYHGEGFPGVLLDAFFAGITVIASNWRFNSEIVKNYDNGLLINKICKDEIKVKIQEVYNDRDLLHKLKIGAYGSCNKYSSHTIMKKFIKKINI